MTTVSQHESRSDDASPTSVTELERILESLLHLSSEPVTVEALAQATDAEADEVVAALEGLRGHYERDGHGLVVRKLAGGYTVSSHPDAEPAARRLLARPRTPPLTGAQAETLAIVAYLQPVSRPEIARIRGVSAESAATTLLERGMIEEAGRSSFGAVLYRTTELFLKLFGLDELASLPAIEGFDPSPEVEHELRERLLRAGEVRAGVTGVTAGGPAAVPDPEHELRPEADAEPGPSAPDGHEPADA